MPYKPPPPVEPPRPSVTLSYADVRLSCTCGRELQLITTGPTVRCASGRTWQPRTVVEFAIIAS
jgi:hypothetical protein